MEGDAVWGVWYVSSVGTVAETKHHAGLLISEVDGEQIRRRMVRLSDDCSSGKWSECPVDRGDVSERDCSSVEWTESR